MEDGCKLELIKWVTTSSNCETAWVEGQLSELGACERGRAAGNAGSANGTKNAPNYCEFLEHGGLEAKYYA